MKRRRRDTTGRALASDGREHVVISAREVRSAGEPAECAECLVAERDIADATSLRRALDVTGERAHHDEHPRGPPDVAPAQRNQLPAAEASVGGDAQHLGELRVLLGAEHGAGVGEVVMRAPPGARLGARSVNKRRWWASR
jgi:hypothetical protein